jgi:hypothetical protein
MILPASVQPTAQDSHKLGQLVSYRLGELVPHPAITRLGLSPSARELSDAITRREQGHWDPITVSPRSLHPYRPSPMDARAADEGESHRLLTARRE